MKTSVDGRIENMLDFVEIRVAGRHLEDGSSVLNLLILFCFCMEFCMEEDVGD